MPVDLTFGWGGIFPLLKNPNILSNLNKFSLLPIKTRFLGCHMKHHLKRSNSPSGRDSKPGLVEGAGTSDHFKQIFTFTYQK